VRLLILAALIYLLWRALKTWTAKTALGRGTQRDLRGDPVDDVMVKDPVCGVYFPKKDGVPLHHGGEERLFCSTECRDRYRKTGADDNPTSSGTQLQTRRR